MNKVDSKLDSPLPFRCRIGRLLMMLVILLTSGCGGCQQTESDKAEKAAAEQKKKEAKKDSVEVLPPVAMPGLFPYTKPNRIDPARPLVVDQNPDNRIKLGHWLTTYFPMVANHEDVQSKLEVFATDVNGNPVPVPNTQKMLITERPFSLPKSQWKQIETSAFLPPRDIQVTSGTLQYTMYQNKSSAIELIRPQPTILLTGYQYHFVVLDEKPDRFKFLKGLDSVRDVYTARNRQTKPKPFYHLVWPSENAPVPWPRSALTCTTIAYAIWGDMKADRMDADQQQAMIDWLHWGGQLILNGPDCLEELKRSFLSEYLPAEIEETINLTADQLRDFGQEWETTSLGSQKKSEISVAEDASVVGFKLKLRDDASFVKDTKEFVCERRVGRGRIVLTAFPLTTRPIVQWASLNNFFNNALLRLPSRAFEYVDNYDVSVEFDTNLSRYDPLTGSNLRFLSRDLQLSGARRNQSLYSQIPNGNQIDQPDFVVIEAQNGFLASSTGGVAAWNDDSELCRRAIEMLRAAAGIKPPSAAFVLKMLAIYLAVLVPLNWLIFRLMGRVEWAWIAAPLISIVAAIAVTKFAALDIGFARARTETGILELHSDYSRGHLTELTALYTSLSTHYDFEFEQSDVQILPVFEYTTIRNANDLSSPIRNKLNELTPVQLIRSSNSKVRDYPIQSNTTGLVHTERMSDVGGSVTLDDRSETWSVQNQSNVNFENALVMRMREDNVEYALIDSLAAGVVSSSLDFSASDETLRNYKELMDVVVASGTAEAVSSSLALRLLDWELAEGEVRMIAVTNDDISPMQIRPQDTQYRKSTLAVVHLRHAPLGDATKDANALDPNHDQFEFD